MFREEIPEPRMKKVEDKAPIVSELELWMNMTPVLRKGWHLRSLQVIEDGSEKPSEGYGKFNFKVLLYQEGNGRLSYWKSKVNAELKLGIHSGDYWKSCKWR